MLLLLANVKLHTLHCVRPAIILFHRFDRSSVDHSGQFEERLLEIEEEEE